MLCLSSLLWGCAHQPGDNAEPRITDTASYHKQLAAQQHWRVEGKAGLRTPQQSNTAWFEWQQQGSGFILQLNGPLGTAATRVSSDGEHYTLSNQQTTRTLSQAEAEEFLTRHAGFALPLDALPFWVLGIPSTDADDINVQYHPDNTLASLQHAEWQLNYLRYQSVGKWLLPEKLVAQRESFKLTLIIKQWDIDPPGSSQ